MAYPTFDKTNKGREEIATRQYHLSPRLRTLLLLINGKRSTEEVLQKVSGIGLTYQNITALLESGFILAYEQQVTAATPATSNSIAPVESSPAHLPLTISRQDPTQSRAETAMQALYNFYTDTIRSAVGLTGFSLQIKVERARSIEDFRKMRFDYLRAVIKMQGEQVAKELDKQLLQLLEMGSSSSVNQ